MEPFLADKIKNDAYQLYKKDWCELRGYVLEDVERAYLADEQKADDFGTEYYEIKGIDNRVDEVGFDTSVSDDQ